MLSLPDFRAKSVVICFATEGQRISFKNDNLIITDKQGEVVLQTTCHRMFALWVVGSTTITSGVLERSRKFGFSVLLLSYSHRPYGIWNSATEGNFLLRRMQYGYDGLEVARHLVQNKIANQAALLRTLRGKSPELKAAIASMDGLAAQAVEARDLHLLLGTEGAASRLYFGHWFADLDWKGRRPRIKCDPLNATLDIGYTYLFNMVEAMLCLYGFDIYQGVYHRCFYQRKSLVCDLVEPFRCIIDRQVRKAHGLYQLRSEHFNLVKGQHLLSIEHNKDYTRWLVKAILDHKEEMFTYVQEYYRCFIRQRPIDQYPVFNIND